MSRRQLYRPFSVAATAILIVGMLPGAALAASGNWYVQQTNTVGGGSCASPDSHTIAGAVALASSGDTIHICAGTYALSATIAISGLNLTFQGAGAKTTILDGGNAHQIINTNSDITLADLTLRNGYGDDGEIGGIQETAAGTITVARSEFKHNSGGWAAAIDAGWAYSYGGHHLSQITVTDSTFEDNDGSPIAGSNITVANSTFVGNVSNGMGGAIYSLGGVVAVTNSTLVGNLAGGGLDYEYDDSPMYDSLTLTNTVVVSTGPRICRTVYPLRNHDGGGNLLTDATCGTTGDNTDATALQLGALADNGGPTRTIALGAGSVAIDNGINAACAAAPVSGKDQRGLARPKGANCDSGAYEAGLDHLVVSPAMATIASGSSQAYTAEGFDGAVDKGDVTADTTLAIGGGGTCDQVAHTCTSGVAGNHTITATDGTATGTATLHVTAAPAPADWPQLGNGPAHQGKSAVETTLSPSNVGALGVKWRGVTGGLVASSPAVVNGVVYAGSFDGKVYAYPVACAVARGAACPPLWTADLGAQVESSPAVVDGVVYVKADSTVADSTHGHLYALSADTGAVLWMAAEPTDPQGGSKDSPTVADGVVYSPNGDGELRAFDAAGVTNCTPGSPTVCTPLWHAGSTWRYWTSVAVANGMVYAMRANGDLVAYPVGCATDGSSCPASWVGHTDGSPSKSTPAVANGKVYVGTVGGYLYAFDAAGVTNCAAATCTPLWTAPTGGYMSGGAAVADGVVYVGTGDFKLYALNADTGALIWSGALSFDVDSSPIIANGVVYVGDNAGYLFAFAVGCNSGGGSCTPLVKVGGAGDSSPAISNGVVYSGSGNDLVAFDLNPLHHLALSPSSSTIAAGGSRTYTAEGFDAGGHSLNDVTAGTTFTIAGGGSCTGTVCTSTVAGDHAVTGTDGTATGTATLHVTPAGDWPSWHSDAAGTGANTAETTISAANVSKLGAAWSAAAGQASSPPVVADGVVYVAGSDGVLRAYPARCGASGAVCASALWTASLGDNISDAPTIADGVVYVGSWNGILSAFDAATGALIWTANVRDRIFSPAVSGGVVYFTTSNKLYAVAVGCNSGGGTCTPIWQANTDTSTASSPVVAGGVVYVGGTGGHVYAFAIGCSSGNGTCDPLWIGTTGSEVNMGASPVVAGGKVYVGASDGYLYAFAVGCASGGGGCSPVWKGNTGGGWVGSPAVADGVVYTSGYGGFYAFGAACGIGGATCSPIWTAAVASDSTAAVANGVVYFGHHVGDLSQNKLFAFAVGCGTGGAICTPLWSQVVPGGVASAPTVSHGSVYIGSDDGGFYAYELGAGAPFIVLSPASSSVAAGAGQAYTVESFDGQGASLGAVTGDTIITVDGAASCLGATCSSATPGDFTVTATYGSETATAALRVTGAALHLSLSPTDATVLAHAGQPYTTHAFDSFGHDLGDVSAGTTFTITGDASCAGSVCTPNVSGHFIVTAHYFALTATAALRVAGAAPADWPQFGNGPTHQGKNSAESVLTAANVQYLTEAWAGSTGGPITGGPVVDNGVVYVGSSDHHLYAFAVGCAAGGQTCSPIWTATLAGPAQAAPAVADDVVYVAAGGKLYAFAVGCSNWGGTCSPLWTADTGAFGGSAPTVVDGVVYVTSAYSVFAFAVGCASGGGSCTPIWTATPGIQGTDGSVPAVADGQVYITSSDGYLYAYAVGCASGGGTCTPVWKGHIGVGSTMSATVAGGVVYVGASYGDLYAFDADCGSGGAICTPQWIGPTGEFVFEGTAPAIADGVVYIASLDGTMYAYAVGCATGGADCEPIWTGAIRSTPRTSPAVANGVVYIGTDFGLRAFAVGCAQGGGTCTPLASIPSGVILGTLAVSNGVVYAGSFSTNNVMAFDLHGLNHITITPSESTVTVGGFQNYTVEGFSFLGDDLGDLTWSASYSADGVAVCGGPTCYSATPGNYTVTASIPDTTMSAQATLHVTAGALDHLVISPADVTVADGAHRAYTVEGFDNHGWSLGDLTSSTVFTIDSGTACPAGVCVASGPGDHVVTALHSADGIHVTAILRVNGPMTHLRLAPAAATVLPGGSKTYTVRGMDAFNHDLGDVTADTTFTVDAGTACPARTCTAAGLGVHTITGTDGAITGTATLRASLSTGWSQFHNGPTHEGNAIGETTISAANVSGLGVAWKGSTDGWVLSSPAVSDGVVYVGDYSGGDSGTLYAFPVGCAQNAGACTPLWTGQIGGGTFSSPAVADDVVYVGAEDGNLYAFAVGCAGDGGTCSPLWIGHTGNSIRSSPTVADGVVYVGSSDSSLYAFAVGCASDGGTCTPLWTAQTGADVMGSPAVDNGVVYSASLDGDLYAYPVGCASDGGTCDPIWTGTTGSGSGSSPVVADGVVYVGSGDGTLFAFAVGCASGGSSCSPLWTGPTTPTPDGITSTAAVADGVVYVGSGDGSLYAFAVGCADNGGACTPIWTAVTPGPVLASPAVASGVVYVGSVDMGDGGFGLYAYGVGCASGGRVCTPLWSAPVMDLFSSPAIQDGVLYVGAMDGLYAFDLGTAPLDHLVLSPAETTTPAGLNATFTAEGFDQHGNDLGDVTAGTTFRVDGADCTLNNCTRTIVGAYTVTGTDGTATGTATLHVIPNAITSIRIGQSNPSIVAGGSQSFTVEGFDPYRNSHGDVTSSTTFSIDGGGSCTGAACTSTVAGNHLVTAHNGGLTDSVSLHVGAGPLASIVISPDGSTITAGGTQAYTAEGFDALGISLGDVTGTTTFTVATGTCTLAVCGTNVAGDHTVTGTDGAFTDTATLHVTPGAATHFLLAGIDSPAVVGVAEAVTVTALDQFGNTATVYAGTVHFTSTDPAATLPANATLTAGGSSFSVTFGTAGTQSVTATDTVTPAITGSQVGITVEDLSGSTYHAIAPARVLDTRPTGGVVVNAGLSGKFIAGTVRTFQVANAHYVSGGSAVAVPGSATAITGNLTVTGATADGVVALGPTVAPTGDTLAIAFARGDTRADSVTIGLGTSGALQAVYRSTTAGASVQVIFDVTGYFTADSTGATYHPLAPGRILDTRSTSGSVTNIGLTGKFKSKIIRTFDVAGVRGLGWSSALVPAGATAVTGNVTVTNATSDGFVSVGPSMIAVPRTSTVNIKPSVNCANGVTVGLSAGKLQAVWVGQSGSSADVVFDVTGYFTADSTGLRYHPLAPVRLLDSSANLGLSGSFVSGTSRGLVVGGAATVPADAAGISGNLTAVNPSSRGWAQLAPSIGGTPTSSTVNATARQTIANGFNVAVGTSGKLSLIWVGITGSTADLQLEVTGYWK